VPKLFTVEAEVHKQLSAGYRVKVSVLDLGMYINGVVVFPPNEDHNDWSVMTPALRSGKGKYTHVVEFNKKMPLWEEVYLKCVDAVKLHISDGQVRDVVITDIPDEPINLDDIPF